MPLIRCPDCQTDVSELAPTCPKCGRPIAQASHASTREPSGIVLGVKIGIGIFIVLPLIIVGLMAFMGLGFGVLGYEVVNHKAASLRSEVESSLPMKEIVDEEVTHQDNVTRSRFVSLIGAPLDKVQQTIWQVENSQQMVENIKMSKLLEAKGNTKLVEINSQGLNLPLQNYTMEFTLHADQHRITFRTIKSQAQDIEGEYKLEASPDGKRTQLTYSSTSQDKIPIPFPNSVLDSANRETYVNTVRGIERETQARF